MAVLLVALTAGCTATSLPETESPLIEPAPLTIAQVKDPTELRIPALGTDVVLRSLGVTADGSHEVPPVTSPEAAGWFRPGPEPGERGAAIILGHVNGGGKDGVFRHIDTLKTGDEIIVDNYTFVVYDNIKADKKSFPTDRVYYADGVELRLITCGGVFDHSARSYKDNIIVFARLKG